MCTAVIYVHLVKQITEIVCHYMDIIFTTPHKIIVKLS